MFSRFIFPVDKTEYIERRKKGLVDRECVLCAMALRDPEVNSLVLYETENFMVCVNLYPYNPGHVMIFPKKHMTSPVQIPDEFLAEYHGLQKRCIETLDKVYSPGGYNIGYNIGRAGGASIAHIHLHIVPRYESELGFVDILSGTKIMIEQPHTILEKLRGEFEK